MQANRQSNLIYDALIAQALETIQRNYIAMVHVRD